MVMRLIVVLAILLIIVIFIPEVRDWFAGRPLDGEPRTDATFFTAGINAHGHRRVRRYWYRPGWHISTVRNGSILFTLGGVLGYLSHPRITVFVLGGLLLFGIVMAFRRSARFLRSIEHYQNIVLPLHRVLSGQNLAASVTPRDYISIPEKFTHDGPPARIRVPKSFTGSPQQETLFKVLVNTRIPGELDFKFLLGGMVPCVEFSPAPAPPKLVEWSEIRDAMLSAKESRPVIGIGQRGKIIDVDFDAESPHIAVSAGNNGGKSVLGRNLVSHFNRHHDHIIIIDRKRVSQSWAHGLPNVFYFREGEEIHNVLESLGRINKERYLAMERGRDLSPHRIVIIFEELNTTIMDLRTYALAQGMKESPAVRALHEILFTGRQARVHMIALAQQLDVRSLGNSGAARENFSFRILGGAATVNTWKMLAPEIVPPVQTRHRGRMHAVADGVVHTLQVPYLTEDEAREFATNYTAVSVDSAPF